MRRASWAKGDEPISTVLGGAENGVVTAKRTKRGQEIGGASVRNIAADDGHIAIPEQPARTIHPLPDIASSLGHPSDPNWQPVARAVGGQGQDGTKSPIPQQIAQQV